MAKVIPTLLLKEELWVYVQVKEQDNFCAKDKEMLFPMHFGDF